MTGKKLCLFCLLLLCESLLAQQDSTFVLREVVVSDLPLQHYSGTLSIQHLNDSIMDRNASSLTGVLQYNSTLYLKQNGLGMVSSPSFRGSTAQQTAVVWNGININSQLIGQTDFNTINIRDFEDITIRAGGGSVLYGSSAIGGSIHLNNELVFRPAFEGAVLANYGSYNTIDLNAKTQFSTNNYAVNLSISRNSSDNDYAFPGYSGLRNENGQWQNTSANTSFGYRFSKKHLLKFYSQYFESRRHLSGSIATVSAAFYEDFNVRNLLDWTYVDGKIRSTFKVAFLAEKYRYFEHYWLDRFESSKAETVIGKHNFSYQPSRKLTLELASEYNETKGTGSNIGSNVRGIASGALIVKYELLPFLFTEGSMRKEVTSEYESPFLYAAGIQVFAAKHYQIKLNYSRNFRMPTFNDLYWVGSGNTQLKAEQANQIELGQELKWKKIRFVATVYKNSITDMIQWKPIAGLWRPENIGEVESYGSEFLLEAGKKLGRHNLQFMSSYAYTVSRDKAMDRQLTFVPFHKFNANLSYGFKNLTLTFQYLFNGSVFTLNDGKTKLGDYVVSNVGAYYHIDKKRKLSLGAQILNCWNESYQSVPGRPMPGRNFQINCNLKI